MASTTPESGVWTRKLVRSNPVKNMQGHPRTVATARVSDRMNRIRAATVSWPIRAGAACTASIQRSPSGEAEGIGCGCPERCTKRASSSHESCTESEPSAPSRASQSMKCFTKMVPNFAADPDATQAACQSRGRSSTQCPPGYCKRSKSASSGTAPEYTS